VSQDLPTIRGLNDQEIQDAIEELKRSTAAIEKQTEALLLQRNAMNTLVKNNTRAGEARSHMDKSQLRKWNVEKGHIVSAVRHAVICTQMTSMLIRVRWKSYVKV
jgi:hypothetical protein